MKGVLHHGTTRGDSHDSGPLANFAHYGLVQEEVLFRTVHLVNACVNQMVFCNTDNVTNVTIQVWLRTPDEVTGKLWQANTHCPVAWEVHERFRLLSIRDSLGQEWRKCDRLANHARDRISEVVSRPVKKEGSFHAGRDAWIPVPDELSALFG